MKPIGTYKPPTIAVKPFDPAKVVIRTPVPVTFVAPKAPWWERALDTGTKIIDRATPIVNAGTDIFDTVRTRIDAPRQNIPGANTFPSGGVSTTAKPGMSMGAKVGIGVGVAAVIGTVVYFATKKGKK